MASTSALVLSIVLVAWAAFMRATTGSWLQPGAYFSLWWCIAGIAPLVLAPREVVGPNAVLWIILSSVVFSAGAIAGNGGFKTVRRIEASPPTRREKNLFALILSISIILGIGSNVAYVSGTGASLSDLTSFSRLVIVANQNYIQRYGDEAVKSPFLSQALLPFVFLAPAIAGIFFELRTEKKWKVVALLAFVPAILVTILQTTKAAILFASTLWFAGYFAARLRLGKTRVFTKGHLLTAAVISIPVAIFFFAVGLARLASTDTALLSVVLQKLISSAFGHMTVFSQWLTDYWGQPAFEPTLGRYTFAGPLEMLGIRERLPGLFDNFIEMAAGETTNIFTAFRPLIEDFSMAGALAIIGLVGFIGGVGYRLVAAGNWSALPLLLSAYTTITWSPITWFWVYNSLTATVIAIGLIVLFIRFLRGAGGQSTTRERIVVNPQ